MRKHYQSASVGKEGDVYSVLLDGRPVRTPARALLTAPTESLAAAIAQEWADQTDTVKPETMHLTAFATTAIDKAGPEAGALVDAVIQYAETDLLCYRATSPEVLVSRQAAGWQPLLDWAATALDAPLRATAGILPVDQPPDSLSALRRLLCRWDGFRLTPVVTITHSLGSAVLGLAVAHQRLSATEAVDLAHIDEDHQAELWGQDAEAAARRRNMTEEVVAAETFLRLLDG